MAAVLGGYTLTGVFWKAILSNLFSVQFFLETMVIPRFEAKLKAFLLKLSFHPQVIHFPSFFSGTAQFQQHFLSSHLSCTSHQAWGTKHTDQ